MFHLCHFPLILMTSVKRGLQKREAERKKRGSKSNIKEKTFSAIMFYFILNDKVKIVFEVDIISTSWTLFT